MCFVMKKDGVIYCNFGAGIISKEKQTETCSQSWQCKSGSVLAYLKDALLIMHYDLAFHEEIATLIPSAENYLLSVQNKDGRWGGANNSTGAIEETALSVTAFNGSNQQQSRNNALKWLDETFRTKGLKPTPTGLYFVSLCYDEKMYPLTACLEALIKQIEA
jgi:hypothetical protein